MNKHILKIKEEYYIKIKAKVKTFEIRINDRDFKVWDTIEFNIIFESDIEEYKSDIKLYITDVFQEKWYWLSEWVCILSFKLI